MVFFQTRSRELELMDYPNPDPKVIRLAIREIEIINRLLGGFNQNLGDIQSFKPEISHLEIQDWGCGSGDLLRKISLWGEKNNYLFDLIGIDLDKETIAYAKEKTNDKRIQYWCLDVMSNQLNPESTDIVGSCLFTHHFTDEAWVELLKKMFLVCRKGIIINDLHRHWLPYYAIGLLTRIFAKSKMVQFDAPLSVAKGFTRKELKVLLNRAGIANYTIRWKWAFRWSVVIFKSI